MLTAEDLLAAGFKEFTDSLSRADRCFQKRVYTNRPDQYETAYFINVYYYVFDYPGEPTRTTWELDMSFDRGDHEGKFPYCWIKYQIRGEATVKDVESMAEAIYIANGGVPYGD
jgi:hypothetical protein